jgi:hypothetical protein
MATQVAAGTVALDREHRFFFISACIMALVLVAGFSTNILLARSSFHSPVLHHVHALTFFGWVVLYLLQTGLVATGSRALHKRLGWLALAWVPAMVVLGTAITLVVVRTNGGPFFFARDEFLIGNPVGILAFAGIAFWAIGLRRRTDWHSRLMLCAMASITGPGYGRLLPMPLMMPVAWWTAAVMFPALFILAGMWRDRRRIGRVHPAYKWGLGLLVGTQMLAEIVAFSPAGRAIGDMVTAGTPGAARSIYAYWPQHP